GGVALARRQRRGRAGDRHAAARARRRAGRDRRCERATRDPGLGFGAAPGERRVHAGVVAGRHVPLERAAGAGARVHAGGGGMSVANNLPHAATRAASFGAWLELTKPRIVSLVLFTGVP